MTEEKISMIWYVLACLALFFIAVGIVKCAA